MRIDLAAACSRLAAQAESIVALAGALDPALARWRPAPERWSVLEICCHLADEEVWDFRARLAATLGDPSSPWPPIDPEGWVASRRYAEQELPAVLARFRAERAGSLAWLRGLPAPDWSSMRRHPRFGAISAADLLASWLAHDLLHARQIAGVLHAATTAVLVPGASSGYAGRW